MSPPRIEPFTEAHLAGAQRVLAARHERHRAEVPRVAAGDVGGALEAVWKKEDVSGAVAISDGRVTGFVLAEIMRHPHFGHCAWVAHAGHAAEHGELVRDLYAAAAEAWVQAGAEFHYVLVPAFAGALAPWYRLGFAHMHVEALRPVAFERRLPPDGVVLRPGTRADVEVAEEIDLEIYRFQARSPSFARITLDREARRRDWFDINLKEDGLRYLVAEERGRLIGHTLIYRPEPVLGVPTDAAYLASTVVLEGERGRGIGVAMVSELFRLAAEAGYGTVFTNWRMTNLSASRFWPSLGFEPIYHRLHRNFVSG